MEITSVMLLYLLWFVIGVVVGVIIMVRINAKYDNRVVNNLLELEDNLTKYNRIVNELRVKLRLSETKLKAYELTEKAKIVNGIN